MYKSVGGGHSERCIVSAFWRGNSEVTWLQIDWLTHHRISDIVDPPRHDTLINTLPRPHPCRIGNSEHSGRVWLAIELPCQDREME